MHQEENDDFKVMQLKIAVDINGHGRFGFHFCESGPWPLLSDILYLPQFGTYITTYDQKKITKTVFSIKVDFAKPGDQQINGKTDQDFENIH